MSIKLNLKISHNISLNAVIRSFISFLPLSRGEFVEKIENEVESNPMLEIEIQDATEIKKDESNVNEIEKKFECLDTSYSNSFEEKVFFKRDEDKIDKNRAIELFASSKVTLADHLLEQAASEFNGRELELAKNIIYNLNKDGYIDVEIVSIASSLNTSPEELDRIRNRIRKFDPLGVASKNLKECLLAQVKDTPENEKLRILISDYLDELSKLKYYDIMKKLMIDKKELSELIFQLKRLNPKPGSNFETEEVDYAEVDLLLIKEGDEYKVKYIEEGMPRLILSQYYSEMLDRTSDKKTKSFLKERHRDSQLFVKGMALRKSLIVQIAEFIVKFQKDFLDFGAKWKKPLTMRDVAKELNYSESTISRAVNNKYIASKNEIISVKSFFSYGIIGEFGFKHSVDIIKDKIKSIIQQEPENRSFSDQGIAEKLSELGIKISRRTIRNYRDEMNIPSSSKRMKEYKIKYFKQGGTL